MRTYVPLCSFALGAALLWSCKGTYVPPPGEQTASSAGATGSGGATGGGGAASSGGSAASSSGATSSVASSSVASSSVASSGAGGGVAAVGPVPVPKNFGKKVYVHMMPWFETPATNNGMWGEHWTMANQNPNLMNGSGQRQIASFYYPLLMKYAGLDGVLIDWPGTEQLNDLPQNLKNCEDIMALTAAVGLDFGIVYEDNNVTLAYNAHVISNEIAAGQADVTYAQNHYFGQSNYIHVNGAPLLLDFGPQTFTTPSDWSQILASLSTKPTLVTLWYQSQQAGSSANGEFAWIYTDFTTGLTNFYNQDALPGGDFKIGVAYPGFNPFYATGGWPGVTWTLPEGPSTFSSTFGIASGSNVGYVQIATWNDYGEGTMIEPTTTYQYGYLTSLQQALGVTYGQSVLESINTLYNERVQYAGNSAKQNVLDQVFNDLVSLQVSAAQSLL
jgi:hypothetical protein